MTSVSTRRALLIIQHSLHIQFIALTNASQCSDRSAVYEPDMHYRTCSKLMYNHYHYELMATTQLSATNA